MVQLALGTVQFGLNYGISNTDGKTPFEEVTKIMAFAELIGVNILDTAVDYGDSEKVIGKLTQYGFGHFKVITKIPPFKSKIITDNDVKEIELVVKNSLTKLKRNKIYGVMFHNISDLFKVNGGKLYSKLLELKKKNYIEKIGFSVYDSEEIDFLLNKYTFDIIQLPINVLDQRLINSGHLSKLKSKDIEVYSRSLFLQGLLLMNPKYFPNYLTPLIPIVSNFHNALQEYGMSPLEGSMEFIKSIKDVDYAVVGVNNKEQLIEISSAFKHNAQCPIDFSEFACDKLNLIDPRRW
ncbi:aldo/keto reductase [Aquibacillus albus]|uniref:Aryl-alcohol dehydrogenase-like predicted oxidoreductase n=1 Tax=Aquibacillus albus TaxID=1168171 RepID=A0ABS2N1Z3_9BACI|nr:aldo/keto reductase [Aquibacillus albus]MBM7572154.1 aryl-alcohol dehydrogenase-like predicted oxidoreductase [Aquibacillus albus]